MCGIAGIITLKDGKQQNHITELKNMLNSLKHRGPDYTEYFSDDKCLMGNTMLKIMDFGDSALLPMKTDDDMIWMAYNGEVTNFKELKSKFKLDEKYNLKTSSDSEVVLYLYKELGINFLNYLTGHFAIAIYDRKIKKVFVIRDFFGLRPIFYMLKNNCLYFASEIKAFFETDCFDSSNLDIEGLFHYFSLGYIPGEHTPFKDIKELRKSKYLEIDLDTGNVEVKEYYRINYKPDYTLSLKNIEEELYDVLLDSVRRNLIAQAPIGMAFSGGVDTSTLLALIKELGCEKQIHTFSIKMAEPSFDESYYQKIMVNYVKPIHHEITVFPDEVKENLIKHIAYLDEPTADGAAIPFLLLAKEARKYIRVMISGEGGDEIFNAYETHGAYVLRNYYRKYTPKFLRYFIRKFSKILPVSHRKLSLDFLLKRFTEGAEMEEAVAHMFWRHPIREDVKRKLMPPARDILDTGRWFQKIYDSFPYKDGLNRIAHLDLIFYYIDDLLVKNDRMVMAHSIEARYPYLDRYIFEYVSRIPVEYKVKWFGLSRRWIQRYVMRNKIPKKILNRRNMGLEMPHSKWFFRNLKDLMAYFDKKRIERTGLFDYRIVKKLVDEHFSKKVDHGRGLWSILTFIIWFELFVYNKDFKKYL